MNCLNKKGNNTYPTINIDLPIDKKIYFASDFHLIAPNQEKSIERERKIVRWLYSIKNDAAAVFLVGDIFDFWFEYNHVVPKGCVRLLGCLAELVEQGIPIHIFTGNHDLWMFDYLEKEIGATIHRSQRIIQVGDKKIFVAHGDGLGPKDIKFKILKKIFTNKICIWLFKWLHPDLGIKLALAWSKHSRAGHDYEEEKKRAFLTDYVKRKLEQSHYDYFIFGHRHIPKEYQFENSVYINIGDWLINYTYAVFENNTLKLCHYEA